MGINFDSNDIELILAKTKELAQMFNGKNAYVKSIIRSNGGEQYTNYHNYKVKDIQFGPNYLYIYGYSSKDRIILKLENIIRTETTADSFKLERAFDNCNHEFEITLV